MATGCTLRAKPGNAKSDALGTARDDNYAIVIHFIAPKAFARIDGYEWQPPFR